MRAPCLPPGFDFAPEREDAPRPEHDADPRDETPALQPERHPYWPRFVVLALSACAPQPEPSLPGICTEIAPGLVRCIDEEEGVACYGRNARDVSTGAAWSWSCVRVDPMPIDSLGVHSLKTLEARR